MGAEKIKYYGATQGLLDHWSRGNMCLEKTEHGARTGISFTAPKVEVKRSSRVKVSIEDPSRE